MDISGVSADLLSQYASLYNSTSTSELDSAMSIDAENSSDEELMDACKQFEQYFVEQMIKEMKNTLPDGSLMGDNQYAEVFEDDYISNIAEEITESGQIGFAQQLYESMSKQASSVSIEELSAMGSDNSSAQ